MADILPPQMALPPDFNTWPPEQQRAWLAQNSVQGDLLWDKSQSLRQQLEQVQALRGRSPSKQYYGWGAGLAGALGDTLGAIGSEVKENRLRAEDEALQPEMAKALRNYTEGTMALRDGAVPNAGYVDRQPGPIQLAQDDEQHPHYYFSKPRRRPEETGQPGALPMQFGFAVPRFGWR